MHNSLIISSLISLPVYAGGQGAGKRAGRDGNPQSMDWSKRGLDRASQQTQEIKQMQERKKKQIREKVHQNDPGARSQEMKQMREREEKQIRERINPNDAGIQRNEMKQIRERNEQQIMEKKQAAQSAVKSKSEQKSKRWYWPFGGE